MALLCCPESYLRSLLRFIHFCFAGDIAEHLMSGEGCASFSWGCLSL